MYPQYWTPSIGSIYIMKYSCEYKKQCVELYRQGKWAETPNDISEKEFHKLIRRWFKVEEACGPEALKHKNQNKVWTAEEKYELVAKALAGASIETTAIKAGISSGLLYQWVRKYKMEGYLRWAEQEGRLALADYMRRHKWTRVQTQRELGVGEYALSRWLDGQSRIPESVYRKIRKG